MDNEIIWIERSGYGDTDSPYQYFRSPKFDASDTAESEFLTVSHTNRKKLVDSYAFDIVLMKWGYENFKIDKLNMSLVISDDTLSNPILTYANPIYSEAQGYTKLACVDLPDNLSSVKVKLPLLCGKGTVIPFLPEKLFTIKFERKPDTTLIAYGVKPNESFIYNVNGDKSNTHWN